MSTSINLSESIPSLNRFASSDPECLAALERVRPSLAAIPEHDVTGVNGDIPTMASIALGAHPDCVRHRAEIAALPGDYAAALDALPDAARAAMQAQANVAAAAAADDEAATLGDDCTKARELLATALLALAAHGYADARQVRDSMTGKSRLDVGRNTLAMVTMMEERWTRVSTKTAFTAEELRAVRVLAERLIESVGVKEHGPLTPRDEIDTRDRAFAYFAQTYGKVRRAIQFIRGEAGDGDRIAPSLWSKSAAPARAAAKPADGADGSTDAPATGTQTPGTTVPSSPVVTPHAPPAGVPQNSAFES